MNPSELPAKRKRIASDLANSSDFFLLASFSAISAIFQRTPQQTSANPSDPLAKLSNFRRVSSESLAKSNFQRLSIDLLVKPQRIPVNFSEFPALSANPSEIQVNFTASFSAISAIFQRLASEIQQISATFHRASQQLSAVFQRASQQTSVNPSEFPEKFSNFSGSNNDKKKKTTQTKQQHKSERVKN